MNVNRVSPGATLALASGLACWSSSAHAYIDPGTGSALFYVITGLILSVYFAVRGLYYRVVEFLFRVRHKGQKCTVAIHCEDRSLQQDAPHPRERANTCTT